MEPIITSMKAKVPCIDGDGMGRAFPRVNMISWYNEGCNLAAGSDENDHVRVFKDVKSTEQIEEALRTMCIEMGGIIG